MKRILALFFFAFALPLCVFAQEEGEIIEEEQPAQIVPRITINESVEVGKKVILDASASEYNTEESVEFSWDLGDGNTTQEGPEIVHTYSETKEYEVTLTLKQGNQELVTREKIFVFDTTTVLMGTPGTLAENIEIVEQAKQNGVFLKMIEVEEDASTVIMEEAFLQKIQEEQSAISSADVLIFRTPSSLGIQAFTRFWQGLDAEKQFSIADKLLIRIADGNMTVAAAALQRSFEVLQPEFLLLTRPEAFTPIFQEKDSIRIQEVLQNRGIEFQIINEQSGPSRFRLLTHMITGFLSEGIPASTILLVLSFPFIAFIVAFFRQVIGFSTYGVFLPIMMALAFQILTLPFSLLVLVVIVFSSFLLRIVFTKLDILFVPRAALMLSVIALSFLSVIWFALRFDSPVSITLAIFPMLVMSTVSEKFLSAQSEEGLRGAFLGAFETIIVAIVAFFLTDFSFLQELLLSLPEIIFIPLLGIFLLGKFTGLRLSEYFRFRSLLREGMEE